MGDLRLFLWTPTGTPLQWERAITLEEIEWPSRPDRCPICNDALTYTLATPHEVCPTCGHAYRYRLVVEVVKD